MRNLKILGTLCILTNTVAREIWINPDLEMYEIMSRSKIASGFEEKSKSLERNIAKDEVKLWAFYEPELLHLYRAIRVLVNYFIFKYIIIIIIELVNKLIYISARGPS